MVRLQVLGSLDLKTSEGQVVSSILAQPKRAALLTFLALARPRGLQRRDLLLALFWPELPEDRARANLSNALYFLRRSLPAGTLEVRGDGEVGVADERIACDALEAEAALAGGRAEDALALYAGDLLPGFHLEDAPEWERWLDDERARLRRLMRDAVHGLAGRAVASGAAAEAARWARRALQLDPGDEWALRTLILLLDDAGDRVGALREYDAFAARLRDELGVDPSPETRAAADAIRARKDARDAAPAAVPPAPAPQPAARETAGRVPAPRAPPPGAQKPTKWRRWAAAALAAGVALPISSATCSAWQRPPPYRVAADPGRVAVLPFAVRGDPGLAHLGAGIADLLAARLDGRDSLRTIDPTALFHAAGTLQALPGDLERSGALSARFGAGQYITGSVVQAGPSIQITASVYRADGKPRTRRSRVAATERDVLPTVDSLVESLLQSELTDLGDTLRMIVGLRMREPCAATPAPGASVDVLGTVVEVRRRISSLPRLSDPASASAEAAARAVASAAVRVPRGDAPYPPEGCDPALP